MSHRQRLENEAPIELVGLAFEVGLKLGDAPVEFDGERIAPSVGHDPASQAFELFEERVARVVLEVPPKLVGVHVIARERRAKDHSRFVAKRVGQAPSVRELRSLRCGLVVHHQRYAGVPERFDSRADCHPGGGVHCGCALFGNPEIAGEGDVAATTGKLDDVGSGIDRFESWTTLVGLHQARDLLASDRLAKADGNGVDERLAMQHAVHVVVGEHPVASRQTNACSRDHRRFGGTDGIPATVDRHALIEKVGEEAPELAVPIAAQVRSLRRHR